MKKKKLTLALLGSVAFLFAASVSAGKAVTEVCAEGETTSQTQEQPQATADQPQEESTIKKIEQAVVKYIVAFFASGTGIIVTLKIVFWLAERKGRKQSLKNGSDILASAESMLAKSSEMEGYVNSFKTSVEERLTRSDELLEKVKKENQDLKEALAVIMRSSPDLVAADAYKKALPYLGVKDNGDEE